MTIHEVDPAVVADSLAIGEANLVDVREAGEFRREHIKGARDAAERLRRPGRPGLDRPRARTKGGAALCDRRPGAPGRLGDGLLMSRGRVARPAHQPV